MSNIPKTYHVRTQQEIAFFCFSSLFCFTYAVVEFFLMVDLWPCHNQFRSCFEPGLNFFFAAQCETRFVKEGLFVVDEAKFKSAMTKQMLPHSVAAWVHIGLKITNFVQECVVSQQKFVHFKKPVARILFFSKLGLFLF